MGFGKGEIKAQLDKLLIYEKGYFFADHQDSEKSDNMMATLIIVLPSRHTGGELVIQHKGKQHTFLSEKNQYKRDIQACAFYADCYHRIKPVRSGYRVVLTFNLLFYPDKTQLDLTQNEKDYQCLKETLHALFHDEPKRHSQKPEKLVCLLDHEYTQRSLRWDKLKSRDKYYASLLQRLASESNMYIYLALADHHQCWDAYQDRDFEDHYYGYDDEDYDDEYTLNSIIDEFIELTNLHGLE